MRLKTVETLSVYAQIYKGKSYSSLPVCEE
jgi:hypothetical protein